MFKAKIKALLTDFTLDNEIKTRKCILSFANWT